MSGTPPELAAWIEAHLIDPDGHPIHLQPYQWALLEHCLSGRPAILVTPRNPDRNKTEFAAIFALLALADESRE